MPPMRRWPPTPRQSRSGPTQMAGGQVERATRLSGLLSDYRRVPVAA
jgi:hypothetical protein